VYKHEITAFLGNAAAATEFGLPASEKGGQSVKMLRTASPLGPESLASFPQRLTSNRANPYFKPGGYGRLKQGLETFANTPCAAGINATLPPASQVATDPNFILHTTTLAPDPTDLYNRIKSYAFGGVSSTANPSFPKPPCVKQGKFKSIGRFPEFSNYLHVRRDP
jgi:phospholipid/cholesterol/gamma-HCH transport system substrate-binding protein